MDQDRIKRIRMLINECFRNQNISIAEIKSILNLVCEEYRLNRAFVVTNSKYKYQMDRIITSGGTEHLEKENEHIMLTVEEYEHMIERYNKNQISEEPFSVLELGVEGSLLHCAIMYEGKYCGTIGFYDRENRSWTDEEKQQIKELSMMLLLYLGINNLVGYQDAYDNQKKRIMSENTISVFYLNLKTGKCHTIKNNPVMKEWMKEWNDYSALVDTYTTRFVDPVYAEQLRERFNLESLRAKLGVHNPSASMDYPRVINNIASWIRYEIELLSCDESGAPEHVMVIFYDVTEEIKQNAYSEHTVDANHNIFVAIAAVDLKTQHYSVYVDNRDDFVIASTKCTNGNYTDLIDDIMNNAVKPSYRKAFKDIFDFENLKEHFENSSDILKFEFPYKVCDTTFWVCLEAVKTQKFSENGEKIMLYYSDITEQKLKEQKLDIQITIDPLTGAYNRAGFEKISETYRDKNEVIGFLIIDIDDFKIINDTYGHKFGDEVLCQVSEKLKQVCRSNDKLFRMGGDEFALLLFDCKEDLWNSVQRKFAAIQKQLKKYDKNRVSITLSAGMILSEFGYQDELMNLADEALYHTKRNGKAGLSQIDKRHKIINEWNDQAVPLENQMKLPEMGNWRVEYTEQSRKDIKLFLNEASHVILQIPNNLSPEECFQSWFSKVPVQQKELIHDMMDKVIVTGQAECTFLWNHPSQGEITLRSGGKYSEKDGRKEINGYLQPIMDSNVVYNYDDGQFLVQAMNAIYYCSYYINIQTKEYYIVKGHDDPPAESIEITFKEFIDTFVHPDYQELVRKFTDLTTLSDRLKNVTHIDCEYLSFMKHGWCRSRFMPVKWDQNGNVTHALCVSASIDTYKKEELEKEWIRQGLLSAEQRVSNCVRKMISMTSHDDAIDYLLQELIKYYDCDRACLSCLTGDHQGTVITEQCNEGITQKFHKDEVLPLTDFMKWENVYSPIRLKKIFCETNEDDAQRWMREAGLENLMILSFEYNEERLGYISIDNIRQNQNDSNWISTLAFFIAHELQKVEQQDKLKKLSYYDTLTACKNRNAYHEMTEQINEIPHRSLGIFNASINGLKAVNIAMGEQYGDQLILKVSGILSDVYDKEMIYRISGAQFLILAKDLKYEVFTEKAEELREKLSSEDNPLASVGYYWTDQEMAIKEIEREADAIMRSDKQHYYVNYYSEFNRRPEYIRQVAEKLAKSQFVVYFQPKCYVQTGKVYGAEALVRLMDQDGNAVIPVEFVHILEQENLISDLDFFVLENVCETLAKWQSEGRDKYQISCNFSRVTVSENNFTERVLEILDRTGVDSSQLIFEITESSNAVPVKKMTEIMLRLKKRKITFALDDMGTEYSTLQMLKLPTITSVKFDRSLISQLEGDTREQYIIENLIHMCHGLEMDCIAEGVENEEQLEMLKKLKCDKIQGFLVGKPMPLEKFEEQYL